MRPPVYLLPHHNRRRESVEKHLERKKSQRKKSPRKVPEVVPEVSQGELQNIHRVTIGILPSVKKCKAKSGCSYGEPCALSLQVEKVSSGYRSFARKFSEVRAEERQKILEIQCPTGVFSSR